MKAWIQSLYNPEIKNEGDNRDYFFDNLKALLILLVVIGHFISNLREGAETISSLYYYIHTFHMPCFVFTSGYMAKSIMKNGKFRSEKYFSVLWLYVVFSMANYGVMYFFEGSARWGLIKVSAAPWYLLALSTWYVLTPLLLSLKPMAGITITTVAGLLIGYSDNVGNYLALSRTIVFLPFFAMGLYLSKEGLDVLLSKKIRILALFILLFSCGYFIFIGNPMGELSLIVMGGKPYTIVLNEFARYGFLIRGGLYLFAILISVTCMLLTPRRKMWYSYVGKYSLTVYILHVLVKNALKYGGVYDLAKSLTESQKMLAIPACVILTLFLANPLFGEIMNWIANPFRNIKREYGKE